MKKFIRKIVVLIVMAVIIVGESSFATTASAATTYTKAKIDSTITSKTKSITSYKKKIKNLKKKIKKKSTKASLKKKYKKQVKTYTNKIDAIEYEIVALQYALTTVVTDISVDLDGDLKYDVNEDYIITYSVDNMSKKYPSDIKWASSNTDVATIAEYNGDLTLSIVGAGDTTISVVCSSSNLITTLDVHVDEPNAYVENVNVASRNITISMGEDYVDNYQIVFADSTKPYDEDLGWSSSDPGVATVTWVTDPNDNTKGTYTIHPVEPGVARISIISDYSEGGTTIDVKVVVK